MPSPSPSLNRLSTTASFGRVFWLFLALAGVLAGAGLWAAWCEFPVYAWNDLRLAPAFAVRHGIDPYPPLGGGPLSTWIYGPVGMLVNLPATFAPTALTALHTAFLINLATLLGPLAVIFFGSAELRARGRALPWFALLLAVSFVPRPNLVLQVADHTAIACGLLSIWCLARQARPTHGWLATAGVLCALAVWSKQIAVFLIPAHLAYLLLAGERRAALIYLGWVAGVGLLLLGVFVAWFGWPNLWFNLVELPGRLPWANFQQRLGLRPWSLVAQLLLPALGLLALWQRQAWPNRAQASGRFFQAASLSAATMLPIGLAGFFKIGGDTNLLHSWAYLLPAFLLWLLLRPRGASLPVVLGLALVAAVILKRDDLGRIYPRPLDGQFAAAESLLATHPGRLWFPQNPVLTFYADGRLWHTEDGVATRHLADYGIREADFRRHLPPDLHAIVYPSIMTLPFVTALLPEYNVLETRPYWRLHVRPTPPPR